MTDSNQIDVEVGGSIRTSNTEETVAESREDCIAKEESALEKNRRCAIEEMVIWNAFKSVVFFICLIFLIIQSVEFLGIYYQYPTNIVTEITLAKDFKPPAVTFCFRSTFSFERFCLEEPDQCKEPSNLEEFCEEYPIVCEGNTSTLKIPKQGPWTKVVMQKYLLNDDYNDDERLFRRYNYSSKRRTFVRDIDQQWLYLKCYSENLHLYQSGSELKTKKLDFNDEDGDIIYWYGLTQTYIKPFYPLDTPHVFLAIHSPYDPFSPGVDLKPIIPEREYEVDVRLEKEEYLLPPPYQTNCLDNGPSEDAKEFTNPNSHQMCMGLCRLKYIKAKYGCGGGMAMIEFEDVCLKGVAEPNISSEKQAELLDKRLICFQNCRQGCLKLHYNYRIKETKVEWLSGEGDSDIYIFVKNPEVTVLRHVPLYGSGEIFSHVGGLLGCWLGISVFTFTDIMEKFFLKVYKLKKRGKTKEKRKKEIK